VIAVIFELIPQEGKMESYLAIAEAAKSKVNEMDGFISVERFESLSQPGKFLSLSFWRDEESVARWRNCAEHRNAQRAGREYAFSDYRLRVALVSRDYGKDDRAAAPADSRQVHG
jgi:heme-degrading monooxygenase HmoA